MSTNIQTNRNKQGNRYLIHIHTFYITRNAQKTTKTNTNRTTHKINIVTKMLMYTMQQTNQAKQYVLQWVMSYNKIKERNIDIVSFL